MEARIVVEIMPCGTKAKTLNPLGELKPTFCAYSEGGEECSKDDTNCDCYIQIDEWQQAESERKVYDIEPNGCKACQSLGVAHCAFPLECMQHWPWKPGSIHEATEINTKQIRIL